ncbi:hypothetical protein H5410_041111, partial [Solanum commersonii]
SNSARIWITLLPSTPVQFNSTPKDQVGGKWEQSAHHREVLRSSTTSPNNPEHDDAKRWCKTAMNYTKGRIAELIRDSD